MSCQIKNGKYFAPNEEPSILHRDLVKEVGEAQANDLFVLSYTPEFKDNVINPLKNNYKAKLAKQLQPSTIKANTALSDVESTAKALEGNVNKVFRNYESFYHQTDSKSEKIILKEGFNTNEVWLSPDDTADYGDVVIDVFVPKIKKPFVLDRYTARDYNISQEELVKNRELYEILGGEANPKTFDKLRELEYDAVIEENGDRGFLYPKKVIVDTSEKAISETYHQAKQDGSNPELIQAVEELLAEEIKPTFKTVEKNGFRTIQMFNGKEMLGYIRLKPYKDGMQVEAVNLSTNTPKGQGFGTELYKMAIVDSLRRDIPFYSDQARTQDAQRVWNKFDFAIESDGRLKVSNLPQEFDENGEIKASKVLQYAYNRNAQTAPLTFAEQQELRQMNINIEDLEKAFYENGLFSPTKKKLEDSGIYSAYEIDRILRYVNLQANIKDKLERLKNTENLELTPIATREEFTEYDLKLNSFGKRVMNNPFVLEQEIVQEFGGLENVDLSEYDSPAIQNNAEKIQEELKQYKRLKVIDESGQQRKNKIIYRQNTYPPTKAITDRIDALLGASDNAFNSDQAQEVKKRLKKDLENIGINLPINTKEDLFLLEDFFLGEELETTNREKVLRIETDRNYVYLETNKSEQDLFDNLNLVATNIPNVYHKVGKITVEAMREITKDNVSDLLTMYKNYFNHPIQRPTEVKEIDVTQITEDVEYLKTDFPKDFAVEKIKNNGNEFYDSFKLTDKGIELISNDSITIEKVKAFIKDGIKLGKQIEQYSLISKSMPKLIETNNLLDLDRVNAVNNPTSISKPQAEFKVLNSELVAVKNGNQEFINVNNNVYEMDRKDGNVTYYSKLETNTDLNYLVTKVEKPTSQKYIIPDLGETDNAKIKKTKSNDNFECL